MTPFLQDLIPGIAGFNLGLIIVLISEHIRATSGPHARRPDLKGELIAGTLLSASMAVFTIESAWVSIYVTCPKRLGLLLFALLLSTASLGWFLWWLGSRRKAQGHG